MSSQMKNCTLMSRQNQISRRDTFILPFPVISKNRTRSHHSGLLDSNPARVPAIKFMIKSVHEAHFFHQIGIGKSVKTSKKPLPPSELLYLFSPFFS